jgi:mRNA interferase RelE/StbE
MPSYRIILKPSVEKDLQRLPKSMIGRIVRRIGALGEDPHPRHAVKLTGAERLYRLRVGEYRIVYDLDKEDKRVSVHYVRHRRDAYRSL